MTLGLEVPVIFVVPATMFHRQRGVNVAEIEFPSYYNYFILNRRTKLIVPTPEHERAIRTILEQSVFGPSIASQAEEFAPDYPVDARPNFALEGEYFRKGQGGRRLEIDELVEFVVLGPGESVTLGGGVQVERLGSGGHAVREGRDVVANIPERIDLPPPEESDELTATVPFAPPAFGLTVLGSSHGFDPSGKTTGFILWIGGRGLFVDPPVDSTADLKERVPSKLIDGVILTHCHADHDSGSFQKILEEGRVNLYTTPTILGSFLRKYSALSGIGEEQLRRTFTFQPVKIGEPVRVHGGEIRFFYALHSIPTIAFEAFFGGKTLAFSSDTLYDPERIMDIHKRKIIGSARAQELLGFPWRNSLVMHEAGVPPLHTPVSALAALPPAMKENLYLVHTTRKNVPRETGLKVAMVGLGFTHRIPVEPPANADAIAMLDAFCLVDLFRDFPVSKAREVLQLARYERFPKGSRIIEKGTPGHTFYVIVSGLVSIRQDEVEVKTYQAGDYFGEAALLLDEPRNADAYARTNVELLALERADFLYLLRGTDIPERLIHLARMRAERSWAAIEQNSVLSALSSAQKTQLQSCFEIVNAAVGDVLWRKGDRPGAAYLVDDAEVELDGIGTTEPFQAGAFLGDFAAVRAGEPHGTSARVVQSGRLFRIGAEKLESFFQDNPGVQISFLDVRFVE